MNKYLNLTLCLALFSFLGCGGGSDGGGGGDIGDNTKGVVLAVGDSITDGECDPAGAPYPSRFSQSRGVTAINAGRCAETARGGASRIQGLLAEHKPQTVLVLYGANDAIRGIDPEETIESLRAIIQACKANKSRVLIGTLLPMYDSHAAFQPHVEFLNPLIRQLASMEKVGLVNLNKEFGTDRALIQPDGLHPSDMGTQIIAFAFADRL